MVIENPFDKLAKDAEDLRGLIIKCEDELAVIEQEHYNDFTRYYNADRWHLLKRKLDTYRGTLYDYQSICDAYLEDKQLDNVYDTLADAPDIHLKIRFDEEEDDTFLIDQIRAMDICVIEEPLTCCDELPEPPDHTDYFSRVVEDPIEDKYLIGPPYIEQHLIADLDTRKYREDN